MDRVNLLGCMFCRLLADSVHWNNIRTAQEMAMQDLSLQPDANCSGSCDAGCDWFLRGFARSSNFVGCRFFIIGTSQLGKVQRGQAHCVLKILFALLSQREEGWSSCVEARCGCKIDSLWLNYLRLRFFDHYQDGTTDSYFAGQGYITWVLLQPNYSLVRSQIVAVGFTQDIASRCCIGAL